MNMMVNPENPKPFIEIELNGEIQLGVNARDVHHWLESKRKFTDWIKARIAKYGFIEGMDYLVHRVVNQVPHQGGFRTATTLEHIVSVDMAKELSMVECTDRGREVRLYYIEQEELARNMKDGIQMRIGKISAQVDLITQCLSEAGRFLSVNGKQTKPALIKELDDLIKKAQGTLPFGDENEGL
ncbi:antA/AntB antirepressor family protein [Acinetobacter puyangensis]|uniref:antA/AntB antirepressor family protein n=1 Tax=Acinetobacter puyangensis TaxID=1096779 RepID=UPI003A4DAC3F